MKVLLANDQDYICDKITDNAIKQLSELMIENPQMTETLSKKMDEILEFSENLINEIGNESSIRNYYKEILTFLKPSSKSYNAN